jgi:hypothetical protein
MKYSDKQMKEILEKSRRNAGGNNPNGCISLLFVIFLVISLVILWYLDYVGIFFPQIIF